MTLLHGPIVVEDERMVLYATDEANLLIQYFKHDALGAARCALMATLYDALESRGIPTTYLERLSDRELLVKRVTPLGRVSASEARLVQERTGLIEHVVGEVAASRGITLRTIQATFGRYGGELLLERLAVEPGTL